MRHLRIALLAVHLASAQSWAPEVAVTGDAGPYEVLVEPPAEDEDPVQLEELQMRLREEQHRLKIARIALSAARQNASFQAAALQHAQDSLAGLQLRGPEASKEEIQVEEEIQTDEEQEEVVQRDIEEAEVQDHSAQERIKSADQRKAAAVSAMNTELADTASLVPEHSSVILSGLSMFFQWLQALPYQHLVAATTGLVGLYSLSHPPLFLQAVAVGVFAVAGGMAAAAEARAYWAGDLPHGLQLLVGLEVAVILAVAAVIGFDGFQLLIGAALGLFVAYLASGWAMVAAWDTPDAAVWYGVCIALGTATIIVGQKTACAVVGTVLGSLMVASSVGFLITDVLTPSDTTPTWLDCVDALLGSSGATSAFGAGATIAQAIGFGFWMVLTVIGLTRWFLGWPLFCHKLEEEDPQRLPLLGRSRIDPQTPGGPAIPRPVLGGMPPMPRRPDGLI